MSCEQRACPGRDGRQTEIDDGPDHGGDRMAIAGSRPRNLEAGGRCSNPFGPWMPGAPMSVRADGPYLMAS
ncbi:hypothetical protein EJ03DRAFT_197918 [Teratosphaeria nubilosa]|uniref:Uncharacterized protein n=1 Tax=Teratosphaeria nubilosa TaxID=161662 RepID=A0A6G1L034_9PEZI|nr:hypothetical protein EJ03DRAFT_197918 [Teratosphaeria nubilosa]